MNRLNVNMIDGQWYWMKVETIVDYHQQSYLFELGLSLLNNSTRWGID